MNVEVLPKDDGFQECWLVCAANEPRFAASTYSEPLTEFTVWWKKKRHLKTLNITNFLWIIKIGKKFYIK